MTTAAKIADFFGLFNQYRRAHSWRAAARIAADIAFRGLPF